MAALAVGPFLYRSLLPGEAGVRPVGCSFVAVIAGLLALLATAIVWLLRRGRPPREPELDRRLWEALRGGGGAAPPSGEGGDRSPSDSVRRSD